MLVFRNIIFTDQHCKTKSMFSDLLIKDTNNEFPTTPCWNINWFWQMWQYEKFLTLVLQIVVHDNFLKSIWSVSILNKDGSTSAWFSKNHVIKSLPVGDNAISVGKICDYQNHPYSIWKRLNVVCITLVWNIFMQYYYWHTLPIFLQTFQHIDHHYET